MSSRQSTGSRKAKGEYIETDSGNKVSRKANISGTANITLGGRTVIQADVVLRGDLTRLKPPTSTSDSASKEAAKDASKTTSTSIAIGRCTIISTGTVIKPPGRISRGTFTYYPMKIGDNVFVGANCVISAASVSSHVHIGEGSVLGAFCIVRENVKVLPGTVVPGHMVIPPGSVVGGRPGRIVGEVGEGWGVSPGAGAGAGGSGEGWVEGGDLRELVRSIK